MPGNERLRSAMLSRGIETWEVAGEVRVDPKTVERWLSLGRTPHRRHRQATAAFLDTNESYLWPAAVSSDRTVQASLAEVLAVYPRRADVPATLWPSLFRAATSQIDVLVYAALFLFEQNPDLPQLLATKAASGCKIRVALGDPASPAVQARGEEEMFGDGIVSRTRLALRHWSPLLDAGAVEVRLHGTTLYNSIYRFDDQMLVNGHIWGGSAYGAPVLHIHRIPTGRLFDVFADNFDAVWSSGTPPD